MVRRRVIVTGATGQLGSAILQAFAADEVRAFSSASLDITDPDAVRTTIAGARPDAIINCAAFNDVDGAEARPTDAFAVNAFAVRSLARAAEAAGAAFVHYSTDFVFDGQAGVPYDEHARPAPASVYAASKLVGEWFALEAPRGFVLRVESLFGSPREWRGRRGTLDAIVDGLEQGRDVRVFTDRVVSPSYTHDVAAATRHLLDTGAAPGLYHCVNAGFGTWHDVAQEAARVMNVPARLVPVTMNQIETRARRPRYCALATGKLAAAGFQMPEWRSALKHWLESRGAGAAAPHV